MLYDNAEGEKSDLVYGIRMGTWNRTGVRICNGTILQGRRGGSRSAPLRGSFQAPEIAGLTLDYHGDDTNGVEYYLACEDYHHNVTVDRGMVISNRHQGLRAYAGTVRNFAWNSLRRIRNWGVSQAARVYENEFYGDSYETNSYMVSMGSGGEVAGNKFHGVGYNPIGVGVWTSAEDVRVHDNFIYLHATANRMRSTEYNRLSGVAGIRLTVYSGEDAALFKNLLFEGNTIVAKPWDKGVLVRGLWVSMGTINTVYRDNTVKVEALTDDLLAIPTQRFQQTIACVDLNGASNPQPPVTLFEGNAFISNVQFISFGSSYGSGNDNALFSHTHLEKIDHHTANYVPFTIGYWTWNAIANTMMNTTASGLDLAANPLFCGTAPADLRMGNTAALTFVNQFGKPLANKTIRIAVDGTWQYYHKSGGTLRPADIPEEFTDTSYKLTINTDSAGRADVGFIEIFHFLRSGDAAERMALTTPATVAC